MSHTDGTFGAIQGCNPIRVLIVDDELEQRRLERDILTPHGCLVAEAENGQQALDLLREQFFDVVLLDKRMPGLDGDEVCQRIRKELGLTLLPVIMVTAVNQQGRQELLVSMQAGANDFIRKPYHAMELVARVHNFAHHKRLTDQLDNTESVLFTLARLVEARDQETGNHCARLAHTATVFGTALGVSRQDIAALRRGGVLHDLGKLGIPDRILLKKNGLDEAEWRIMRQHTLIGARLLQDLQSMHDVIPIVRSHHERWDGSGYPDGLAGENIPWLARIFQIVDIHDALAYARPYKPALPRPRIIEIFEQEKHAGWRDPELINTFLDILHQRPDCLRIPDDAGDEVDSGLFASIARSGILDWYRPS